MASAACGAPAGGTARESTSNPQKRNAHLTDILRGTHRELNDPGEDAAVTRLAQVSRVRDTYPEKFA